MRVLMVDMNSQKNSIFKDEFVRPIEQILKDQKVDFKTLHFSEINSNNTSEIDRVILSGTALKDFSYLTKFSEFDWIKSFSKPVLGICAGAQVIGKLFGGELADNQEIGMIDIEVISENNLFSKDARSIQAYALHNKSVTGLDEFEILAESQKCIQAFKLKEREIYGVLFHPEVKNHDIIINFIKIKGLN